jgi:hypothetical protein
MIVRTVDEYMNDPAIADEPMGLRQIHAIRLKLQDDRKGMTAEEYAAAARKNTEDLFTEYGIPIEWAHLKPVSPVTNPAL